MVIWQPVDSIWIILKTEKSDKTYLNEVTPLPSGTKAKEEGECMSPTTLFEVIPSLL